MTGRIHETPAELSSPSRPDVLVKVGGSLLDWPLLPVAWQRWWQSFASAAAKAEPHNDDTSRRVWVLAGGGAWVETLRLAQTQRGWSDTEAHWLAIQAMGITARVLGHRLALPVWNVPLCSPAEWRVAAQDSVASSIVVVNLAKWLYQVEPQLAEPRLAQNWSVTSDSIALRLATLAQIPQLVLAKSCAAPTESAAGSGGTTYAAGSAELEVWSARGFVDTGLARLASPSVQVQAVDFRQMVV